jgi:hypothetical protein
MSTSGCFLECLPLLSESFDSVWAVDLPGFGVSKWELRKEESMIKLMLSAVDCVVSHVQEGGAQHICLAGHSFGSFVAGKYVLEPGFTPKISSVVLISPVGLLPQPTDKSFILWWSFFFKDLVPMGYHGKFSWGNSRIIGSLLTICWLHMKATWNDPIGQKLNSMKHGPFVQCVYAGSDSVVPVDNPLKDRTPVVIAGAGHMSLLHGRFAKELCNVLVRIVWEAQRNKSQLVKY